MNENTNPINGQLGQTSQTNPINNIPLTNTAPNSATTDNVATKPKTEEEVGEKVFDISPDLNIRPVTEKVFESKKPIPNEQLPKTPLQNVIGNLSQRSAAMKMNVAGSINPNPNSLANKVAGIMGTTAGAVTNNPNVLPKGAVRTYESDVAKFMSSRKTSVATIAIAENARKEGSKPNSANITSPSMEAEKGEKHSSKKLIMTLMSLILIAGGIYGGYYLYKNSAIGKKTTPDTIDTNPKVISLVPADSKVSISIDGMASAQIIARIKNEINKSQAPNTIKEITLTKTDGGIMGAVNIADILNTMNIQMPDMLFRSLTNPWMIGNYADASGNKDLFVVASNNFFQNAFAGMLAWEDVMSDELKAYFEAPVMDIASSTTASTSTTPNQSFTTLQGNFYDGIVKNRDIREFRDNTGNPIFLYSFLDNSKIIVTSKSSTLTEILNRLEQRAFIR